MKTVSPNVLNTARSMAGPPGRLRWLPRGSGVLLALALFGLAPFLAEAAAVRPRFDLDDRRGSPFPSDRFTVADATQSTSLRVNLPKPDCAARPNDCQNLDVINTLDGFNVQPRLSIPFDGPIDASTVTSDTVFLVRLGLTRRGGARRVGVNQVVWDVATNTLHVEADELLDQHTSYALIVTRGVRDVLGDPVEPAQAFQKLLHGWTAGQTRELKVYRLGLLRGIGTAALLGVRPHEVVVASVFTTQSVTALLERIRDQIKLGTPAPADFAIGPSGARAVYPVGEVTDIVSVRQTGTAPSFTSATTPFLALSLTAPGAVGTVAFGKYRSPDYLNADRYVPLAGTRLGTPAVQATNEVFFNLTLPATPPPPVGWPVAIFGHGSGADKQLSFLVAAKMAEQGIATIAINAVGHGFGPLSTLSVLRGANPPIALLAGGRGIDTNGNGQVTSTEGSFALAPRGIIRDRDARIQTAADLMQLVRVIEVGMDVDGDGVADLDPSRISYFGHSLGGNYGAVFLAAEANVRSGVLVAPGGPPLEGQRLSPLSRASGVGALLVARVPSLINLSGTSFNENLPLRDQPPVVNTVPGTMEIQELLDNFEWVGQGGDVVPYGRYLRRAPLEGIEPKSMIIQFARGDRTLPNPTTTAILRAGDLADRATYYRFDRFLAENPTTPPSINDPHGFIFVPPPFVPLPDEVRAAATAVSLAAQEQIALFFASDGVEIIDPDGADALFETPIALPLPEEVVFFP